LASNESVFVIGGVNCSRGKQPNVAALYLNFDLDELIELRDHPWFSACQFHPEFQTTPDNADPLFRGMIEVALKLLELSGYVSIREG
jgi:carbamoylphosphate synthase small subunit